MAKFCKVFENKEGAQLLIFIKENEDGEGNADFVMRFELDAGVCIQMVIGDTDWDKAEKALEEYTQEKAEELLKDPLAYIQSITE